MHRERRLRASLDQAKFCFGQSGTIGRVQGYITSLSAKAKLGYTL